MQEHLKKIEMRYHCTNANKNILVLCGESDRNTEIYPINFKPLNLM